MVIDNDSLAHRKTRVNAFSIVRDKFVISYWILWQTGWDNAAQ
jgi:hypothetical protein